MARIFAPGHALSVMFVPGWHSWNFCSYTRQSVIIVVFIESRGISNGTFSIFILFSIPLRIFFDFANILHGGDHKNEIKCTMEMPVTQ